MVVEKGLTWERGVGGTFPKIHELGLIHARLRILGNGPHIGPSVLLDGYVEFNISAKKGK
jgi:hypothetical protein